MHQVIDILMTADLFAGDPHMEGNDMAGPGQWHADGPDSGFQGQPAQQQVSSLSCVSLCYCQPVTSGMSQMCVMPVLCAQVR